MVISGCQRGLALGALLLTAVFAKTAYGYSVLSHEALVDALWLAKLKPALILRFPDATEIELNEAHAYAYGGAIIQDMGYYPGNNGYFSDLTHYCRTADFITALLADAQTLDEYAFSLGALSHYWGDNVGHRLGTNVAEPELYPKLRKKYGDVVTYAENPEKHLQTEYGFDVRQVSKGKYASEAYHNFIGFQVAKPLLKRAFEETYGFDIESMYGDFDKAIQSYRYTLSNLIPFFTRVAWANHENDIRQAQPGVTKRQFVYKVNRARYRREWDRPSLWDRIVAFIVKLLPPIGEIKILRFKALTPPVNRVMRDSFSAAVEGYGNSLSQTAGQVRLENYNFDVGAFTKAGQYSLADDTYAYWLDHLAATRFAGVTPAIKENILQFYGNLQTPIHTNKHQKHWKQVLAELEELRACCNH